MPDVGDYTTPQLLVTPFDGTTAAALTVHAPDGSTSMPAASTSDVGHTWTSAPVQFTQAGRWVFIWTVTGVGAGVEPQVVDVSALPEPVPAAITGSLFSFTELNTLPGITATTDEYNLAHELVLDAIEGVVGSNVLTAPLQRGVKTIALEAAKRFFLNPGGLRERAIDDYREVYATETLASIELTDLEVSRLRRLVGQTSSAFTVRPAGTVRAISAPGVTAPSYEAESSYVLQRRYPWS